MSETKAAKNLAEAKLRVMQEVGYCLKTKSQGLNYTYASETELIAALRPALIEHGISFAPVDVQEVDVMRYETKRGTTMFVTRMKVTYRFTHSVSKEYEDIVVMGEGGDVGDKDVPKAMTCALKYALRQTFLIETGDDPDKHASQPAVASAAVEKSVQLVLGAIDKATDVEVLEKYRTAYLGRGFVEETIAMLDRAYTQKLSVLVSQLEEGEKADESS